jgi:hypothetical protein
MCILVGNADEILREISLNLTKLTLKSDIPLNAIKNHLRF